MDSSDCIVEGLYLGGVLAALNEKDLAEKGISHILSVDESALPDAIAKRVTYRHVKALDVSDCDLISCFPVTFVFIEQARVSGGHVLVHCQAGVSRSATVVCAYLMQKMSLSKDKGMELMASRRPSVGPNSGFLEQLHLFEMMGCQVVKTHPLYRAFRLRTIADRFQAGSYSAGASDSDIMSDLLLDSDFSSHNNDAFYKCRKCRSILFRHGAVTSHVTGRGESAFDWRGRGSSKNSHSHSKMEEEQLCQKSLFVDPLKWMKGKINETCGKLHCPKCVMKIGSYVWYGEKCPCGAWVAPAFHIDSGKVDKIPFQTVLPSARMVRGTTSTGDSTASTQPSVSLPPDRSRLPDQMPIGGTRTGFSSLGGSSVPNTAVVAPVVSIHPTRMDAESGAGISSASSLHSEAVQMDVDS